MNNTTTQMHSNGLDTSIAAEPVPTRADTSHPIPEQLDILYFGNDWAAENRTSSHHMARWLARGNRVYYLECPGMRAPKGSARDLKKIWSKVVRFAHGPRPTPEGLKVWTVLQLPLHRFRFVRWINRMLILGMVRWLKRAERVHDPVAWFLIPHLSSVVGRLGERLSVYYCTDDHSALPNVNEAAIRAMDEELTRKADLVFVTSETLLTAKRQLNSTTRVSPHGVDAAHFAAARDPGPIPADIAGLAGPIIGYFGLIEQWMDWDLVEWLAANRPGWQFVMIGRVGIPADRLPRCPNLHFLGKRPYAELPAYGRRFDAAIIPSRLDHRFAQHASPLKLREYLAMGVPVVAAPTPENRKFADVVALAGTREQFLAHLDAVVGRPITPDEARRRMDLVADQTWDARGEAVFNAIKELHTAKESQAGR